ncbi:uncharacterized protein LOC141695884 [Apium graveolens]|uniref:uncharacterized protein LOC141695884 n=1 Tax=Apium graveolens TaxID=4045 RepID=UPI003D7C007C
MSAYLNLAISLGKVSSWTIKNICREENLWADALSKLASSVVASSEGIYVEERKAPSIYMNTPSIDSPIVNEISSATNWRQPISEYILENKLPQYKGEARAISYKAKNYCVLKNKLYHRGLVEPLLRCLGPEESNTSIVEVHTGICGDHLGGKNLALKIMRFRVPRIVVTDNRIQFVGEKFTEILSQLKIKHIKSSVAYPQENGQVEVSIHIILQGLKKRVNELPRSWVDELPNVLWSYRTTFKSATGISPFKMAFGLEVVSPVEVYLNSPRVEYFDVEVSCEGIQLHNFLMEEVRDEASIKVLQQHARTTAYFNKK